MSRRMNMLLLGLAALLAAVPAAGQDATRTQQPGEELTVFLATVGQGEYVWELFGHNAIWIQDAATRSTIAYNYGIFDFDQPGFVPRLMRGRMLYSMGVRSADEEVRNYTYFDRPIWLQRLNMTAEQKHALREFLEWNWLPENSDYIYDYFRDNCSTRIRDALDRALGGAIRQTLEGQPTGETYRSHSLRLTGARLPVYTGLLLGLGQPTDRPIDAWEEGFIPMQLMAHLRQVQVPGPGGASVPLVAEESTLHESSRPPELAAAPDRTAGFLLVGVLVGALLVLLGRAARRYRNAAGVLALAVSLWGITTGFFGVLLALLWVATDHTTSYANQNLLQVNPLGFLLAIAGPLALVTRRGRPLHAVARLAFPTALALLGLSGAGLLLQLVGMGQGSGPIIALALPVHAGVVAALYHCVRREPSPAEDASDRIAVATAA